MSILAALFDALCCIAPLRSAPERFATPTGVTPRVVPAVLAQSR